MNPTFQIHLTSKYYPICLSQNLVEVAGFEPAIRRLPDYAPLAILSFPCGKFLANSRQIKMKRFRSGDEGLLR